MVSWDDAQAYIAWLNGRTGKTYRLLTESEWEYCCRAGTTTPHAFGSGAEINAKFANFNSVQTEPVTQYPVNGFGLSGMYGNVREWCEDCWNVNYQGAPCDGTAWLTGQCEMRVLRGASWDDGPWTLRSAARFAWFRGERSAEYGFRIACTTGRGNGR